MRFLLSACAEAAYQLGRHGLGAAPYRAIVVFVA